MFALRNLSRRGLLTQPQSKKLLTSNMQQQLRCMSAETVYKFGVGKDTLGTIEATLPLVAEAGPKFTEHFYARVFKYNPGVMNIFNQTNQAVGSKQPKKLFKVIAIAATAALQTGELPGEAIEGICQKHCALGLNDAAYDVVGENLLKTIEEMFTDDPSVIAAWAALYGDIKSVFLAREHEIYKEMEATPGGWTGRRQFKITKKEEVSSNITRFVFEPVDGGAVPEWKPSKYTTVWFDVDAEGKFGHYDQQPRHYTLGAAAPDEDATKSLTISVKKEDGGLCSNLMHAAEVGATFDLSAPYGNFNMSGAEKLWLVDHDTPVVFLSGGVGITPVLSMLENIYQTRAATWLHANLNGGPHAYRDRLRDIAAVRDGQLVRRVWYTDPLPEDGQPNDSDNQAKFHFKGLMDLTQVSAENMHLNNPEAQYYMCGPNAFMEAQQAALLSLGISGDRIHSEGF